MLPDGAPLDQNDASGSPTPTQQGSADPAGGSGAPSGLAGKDGRGVTPTTSPEGGGSTPVNHETPDDASGADDAVSDPTGEVTHRESGDGPNRGRGQSRDTTEAIDVELPELEIETLTSDEALVGQADRFVETARHPLMGIWEQVDGPGDSDFGPGGYIRSVVALNPSNNSLSVYRLYRGEITTVVGGELAIDCSLESTNARRGGLTVRVDPSLRSSFRATPLNLGGEPAVVMSPPMGSGPWELVWERIGTTLTLGGKRYVAITRKAFEELRRGGGDVATAADMNERIAPSAGGTTTPGAIESSFFGLRGGGKRVCFIVDISGSMSEADKLQRLKNELSNTLRAFKGTQQFSIVFFSDSAHVIEQGWMEADRDRARALGLVAQQGLASGTNPTQAFNFAFKTLNPVPDCIFFMTDGEVPESLGILELLRQLNSGPNPTRINTINFGAPASELFMKQIARENRGNYIFVPQ